MENGGYPGNFVAWNDPAANSLTNNFFRDMLDTLRQSYLRPRHHGFADFQIGAEDFTHVMIRVGTVPKDCFTALRRLYVSIKRS